MLFLALGALGACRPASNPLPQAQQGILDARSWNWQQPGTIVLEGEWLFYWNQLLVPSDSNASALPSATVTLPSAWNGTEVEEQSVSGLGCATYQLRVLLPPYEEPLALRLGNASTALRLLVNGQEVYQAGTVGCRPEDSTPQYANEYVLLNTKSDILDITLQMANFYNREGGPWSAISLGTERNVRQVWRNDIVTDFFLIGSILMMAIYHIILFSFRKKDRSSLYFSLFCLAMVIRIATVDNYVINFFFTVDWAWLVRLEYSSFYVGVPLFVIFFYYLFPSVVPKRFTHTLWMVATLLLLIVLVLPPRLFAYTTIFYQGVTALAALYVVYLMIVANLRRLSGSRAFAIGFVVLFLSFINDTLTANRLIQTPFLFSLGLFAFIFFQTFLLSKRFSRAFGAVEEANNLLIHKNEIINERNEELKQLNNELDVFVYRTSHDLRSPISSVMGLINIMRTESDTQQLATYLDLQEESLLKLDNFIQDILNYSRNSRLEISLEPVNFQRVLDDVFSLHNYLPNFIRIDKKVTINQEEPFMTDSKRLTIVLNNLISNAIRYCNLQQAHSYLDVTIEANASFAQITIADNGIGIAAEHVDKIFDMFYRATTETKGSGLGLFITKEMVKKLRGTIQVRSQLQQGTTFIVIIPNLGATSG